MVEVICSHFMLKKIHGMNLKNLMPLVMLACGQLDKGLKLNILIKYI